jgi:hypothetical protein
MIREKDSVGLGFLAFLSEGGDSRKVIAKFFGRAEFRSAAFMPLQAAK